MTKNDSRSNHSDFNLKRSLYTMPIPFTKAQALGNDFVLMESLPLNPERINHIADRRLGIGCDQVIFFQAASETPPHVCVQFYNADGSEAEACGNGSRALVTLLAQRNGDNPQPSITLRTKNRDLAGQYDKDSGMAAIHMGLAHISEVEAPLLPGQLGSWGAVDLGNPHLIAFVADLNLIDLISIGPSLENHPAFPNRTNVSVAQVQDGKIFLQTWERGAGYTGACGTAACATVALAHERGLIDGKTQVFQKGGDLWITPSPRGIHLSGPATITFHGEIEF
jgi:diaminopimelate epimerase